MRLSDAITALIDRCYWPPFRSLLPRQTFRYAVCGGVNYLLLDPLTYFLVYNYLVAHRCVDLGVVVLSPHIAALCVVFPITFFVGFWLNRNVVFRHSPLQTHTQLGRYLLSVGGSIVLTYLGVKGFVEWCGIWPTPAKVLTTVVVTIYSYLIAKYFSFRHSDGQ